MYRVCCERLQRDSWNVVVSVSRCAGSMVRKMSATPAFNSFEHTGRVTMADWEHNTLQRLAGGLTDRR